MGAETLSAARLLGRRAYFAACPPHTTTPITARALVLADHRCTRPIDSAAGTVVTSDYLTITR